MHLSYMAYIKLNYGLKCYKERRQKKMEHRHAKKTSLISSPLLVSMFSFMCHTLHFFLHQSIKKNYGELNIFNDFHIAQHHIRAE